MPEIYEMLFGLSELFRLFPQHDCSISEDIERYEAQIAQNMAENRIRLFGQYGYESEFDYKY